MNQRFLLTNLQDGACQQVIRIQGKK